MPEPRPLTDNHSETKSTDLMSIGEFSMYSRLTQKALRLYDSLGLLPPAKIDPNTGYRLYSSEQLTRAALISVLRQLEMPLQQIMVMLELESAAAGSTLTSYWHSIEAQHRHKRALYAYLKSRLEGKGTTMFEVLIRNVPEQKLAVVSKRVGIGELSTWIGTSFSHLYGLLNQTGINPAGPSFVAYYGKIDNDNDGMIDVCVPFIGQLEPTTLVSIRLEPSHQQAYVVCHKGIVRHHEQLMQAYDSVAGWLQQHGKRPSLPCREIYFGDWEALGDDDPAFDVAYPFAHEV
jgi:DNA-binding transcriptional MerR regulator